MKISHKLIIAFSIFTLILIAEIVLNQIISEKAKVSYTKLSGKIAPALEIIDKCKTVNTEVYLLGLNKLSIRDIGNQELSNRIKGITEVELPYLKTEIFLLQENYPKTDDAIRLTKEIITLSNKTSKLIKRVNKLLVTSDDYKNNKKFKIAETLVRDDLLELKKLLEFNLSTLEQRLKKDESSLQLQIADDLRLISKAIFYTGSIGILLCLIIAFQVIQSISKPAKKLIEATTTISEGDYSIKLNLKGNDEFAVLSNSFNKMTEALNNSFKMIEEYSLEIERRKNNLIKIFNSAPNGLIFITDEGKIDLINSKIVEYFGFSEEELENQSYEILFPPIQFPLLKNYIELGDPQILNTKSIEKIAIRKNNSMFNLSLEAVEIVNTEGTFLLLSVIDITERKNKEALIQSQMKELKKINTDLEQFSYVATHDIKVPLSNIESFLSLLKLDSDIKKERSLDAIQWIDKSVTQGSRTVQDLVMVTRMRNENEIIYEKLNLREILEEVLNELHSEIVNTATEIKSELLVDHFFYNRIKAKSILLNLLSNALKYRSKTESPKIIIKSKDYENFTCVSVKDNGIGINLERDQDKVFGLFKRAHRGYEGSGLGLYLTKMSLENTGGKIKVESEEGKGSTFTVYFHKK